MKAVELQAVGDVDPGILDRLAAGLAGSLRISCRVRDGSINPSFAYEAGRNQYYATALLAVLSPDPGNRIVGVTSLDLFVPILTFVFGEAQLEGPRALVSLYRLGEEHYGLPRDPARLDERLLKEALHELGHTFGLRHCAESTCVMSSSHNVERIDAKEAAYCPHCLRVVRNVLPGSERRLLDFWRSRWS